MSDSRKQHAVPLSLYTALCTALAATLASVYFIELLGNPAAWLCWFERMLMFGLVLILTVGIWINDLRVKYYAIPFLLFGIPTALFQQLAHWNIIDITSRSCSTAIVCTTKFFELFGFITQATLCLTAFIIIAISLWKVKIR